MESMEDKELEKLDSSDLNELIVRVSKILKKGEEDLKKSGEIFNIFSILGVNQKEVVHSKILAMLLNPKGSHCFEDEFLKAFIDTIKNSCSDEDVQFYEQFDCKNAIVKTEASANTEEKNGRIDILIVSDQKAIIIENKLNAGDQPKQLRRYDESVSENKRIKEHKIIYLTKDGHEASEDSAEKVAYLPISYSEEIMEWLEKCETLCKWKNLIVGGTIFQYKNLLKKYTGQGINKMTENEIIDILKDNLTVTGNIYSYAKKAKEAAARENINQFFNRTKGYETEILFKNDMKSGSKFWLYKENWKNLRICFEFEENELHKFKNGILIKENGKDKKVPKEKMIEIREKLNQIFDLSKSTEPTDYYIVRFYDEEWPGFYLRNVENSNNQKLIDHLKNEFDKLEKMALKVEELYPEIL